MKPWVPVFLALVASACSNAPVRIESRALADQTSRSPEHFIVAAVDNDPNAFVAPARSTPRGDDNKPDFGPRLAAGRTMPGLEDKYRARGGEGPAHRPLPTVLPR